jgi:hypothetical protein
LVAEQKFPALKISFNIYNTSMDILKTVLNVIPLKVASGPFRGTRCRFTDTGDGVVAKLLGTYECELHAAFCEAIAGQPELVVDVGAAEGFYVAALARALPEARVIAYEAKLSWHPRLQENLDINRVAERCELRGLCEAADFASLAASNRGKRMLLIMDIEGAEFQLLSEEAITHLKNADLLIELHEPTSREAGDNLIASLEKSHEVEVLWQMPRSSRDIKPFAGRAVASVFPPLFKRIDEGRIYRMRWLWARPHSH